MKRQLTSFKVAFWGIGYTLTAEPHMRFHLVISIYVIAFANFFHMTPEKWSILFLTAGGVMITEMFNTAVEVICDLQTGSYHPLVKIIKDISSGAVLIAALVSVAVAFFLFGDMKVIGGIVLFFRQNPGSFVLFALSLIVSAAFVLYGPLKIKTFFIKKQ